MLMERGREQARAWDEARIMAQADEAASSVLAATLPLMKAPPVDLGAVCRWLGFDVYARSCDAFGAVCVVRADRRILMVNAAMSRARARFSIAHELGHVLLGHSTGTVALALRDGWQERQADRFAATLLMPQDLLEGEPSHELGALSRRYCVSREAMGRRLRSLRIPVVVAPMRLGHRDARGRSAIAHGASCPD